MAASTPAAPVPPSRQAQHEAIARVAQAQSATRSTFTNGVSVHRMQQSVSFSNLRAILRAAVGQQHRCFVGTVDGNITVSVNFNYERSDGSSSAPTSRKRKADPHEEPVEAAAERVRRGLTDPADVTEDMLEGAKQALLAMLRHLRGSESETPVESWGLAYKKPESPQNANGSVPSSGAQRPRLIISARLTPGVAVPLHYLFQALGVRCTADGMLTTQDSTSLATGFNLPLSEQARAAESHGQRALTLFATVSRS